jgi:hypothetical protein
MLCPCCLPLSLCFLHADKYTNKNACTALALASSPCHPLPTYTRALISPSSFSYVHFPPPLTPLNRLMAFVVVVLWTRSHVGGNMRAVDGLLLR